VAISTDVSLHIFLVVLIEKKYFQLIEIPNMKIWRIGYETPEVNKKRIALIVLVLETLEHRNSKLRSYKSFHRERTFFAMLLKY